MNERMSEAKFSDEVREVLSRCDQNDTRVKVILSGLEKAQFIVVKRLLQSYATSIVVDPSVLLSITEKAISAIDLGNIVSLGACRDSLVAEEKKIRLKNEIIRLCGTEVEFVFTGACCCYRIPKGECVVVKGEDLFREEAVA